MFPVGYLFHAKRRRLSGTGLKTLKKLELESLHPDPVSFLPSYLISMIMYDLLKYHSHGRDFL